MLPPTRQEKKLWEIYDITSSKRVFQNERKNEWVPFYRAREIVKLAENWFVNNELFISEEMYEEYKEKYGIPQENDIMVTGVWTIWICYFVKKDDRFYFKDGNIVWFKNRWLDVNSRFVEYLFKTDIVRNQIDNNAGSVVATLTIQKAKEIKIPLPPLATQKLIVEKLDAAMQRIDRSIALLDQNLAECDALWQSGLSEVFEKNNYEVIKIKNVIQETKNINPTNKPNDMFTYIDISAIDKDLQLITSPNNFLWSKAPSRAKKEIRIWDILFATTRPNLKNIAIILEEYTNPVASTWFCVLRVNENIKRGYLFYFLTTENIQKQIEPLIRWAQYPAISDKNLLDCKIPLPPLDQQEVIVANLDQVAAHIDSLRTSYKTKKNQLLELKASVLHDAFYPS
jgi:type I restriction enzyme S subunit